MNKGTILGEVYDCSSSLCECCGYTIKPSGKISLYYRLKACWLVLIGRAYIKLWYSNAEIKNKLDRKLKRDRCLCTNNECENYDDERVGNCRASKGVMDMCLIYKGNE